MFLVCDLSIGLFCHVLWLLTCWLSGLKPPHMDQSTSYCLGSNPTRKHETTKQDKKKDIGTTDYKTPSDFGVTVCTQITLPEYLIIH